jgi:hypothetical protein
MKINIDFSYCNGENCDKKYECKRYYGNYKPEQQKKLTNGRFWWVFSNDCVDNNYLTFVPIETQN